MSWGWPNLDLMHRSRTESTMRTTQPRDPIALVVSVFVTWLTALGAAWLYGIAWADIAAAGVFGAPVFVAMFAAAIGVPTYYTLRYLRRRTPR